MAKASSSFICQDCGSVHSKWTGQCTGCSAWNTLVEEVSQALPKSLTRQKGRSLDLAPLEGETPNHERLQTNSEEFNRVCGGGLVPGSVTLVGGDPGIGKSTLLLQMTADLASKNHPTIYISGEEAIDQIRMRAKRLEVEKSPLSLASATNVGDILATLEGDKKTRLVVIDSIQTMYVDTIDAAPGSVSQVRACAHDLIRYAKKNNVAILLVGHVTKEGTLAGPRVLEHMVDTVLYFEGERGHQFRILRSVKNRFGATDEIGVFAMTQLGLQDVLNPSSVFLGERTQAVSGVAVCAGVEGTRPLLVEIQALVAPSSFGTPRRTAIGWDPNRLAMVLAVLEARCGLVFGTRDVYLSVAGGMRIQEPAADLAVAAALTSALFNTPLPHGMAFAGEIGLSGEIRPITHLESRVKEAEKLGFEGIWVPQTSQKALKLSTAFAQGAGTLREFLSHLSLNKKAAKEVAYG